MITVDSKLRDIVEFPEALEVFDKYIPGFSKSKRLKLGYSMSFRQLSKFTELKEDQLGDLNKDLIALGLEG